MEYTFKRLVDGLGHARETARPGFSLALGHVSGNHPYFHLSVHVGHYKPNAKVNLLVIQELSNKVLILVTSPQLNKSHSKL